jgi:hypothetical protein
VAVEVQHIRVLLGERQPLAGPPHLHIYEPIKESYGQDCNGDARSPSKGIDNNCALCFFHVWSPSVSLEEHLSVSLDEGLRR